MELGKCGSCFWQHLNSSRAAAAAVPLVDHLNVRNRSNLWRRSTGRVGFVIVLLLG